MNDLSRKALDFRFKFGVNEFVEICGNLESVKSLQRGHGEWADDMIPVMNSTGINFAIKNN